MKFTGKDHGTHAVMQFGPTRTERALYIIQFFLWDIPKFFLWEFPKELWRRRKERR